MKFYKKMNLWQKNEILIRKMKFWKKWNFDHKIKLNKKIFLTKKWNLDKKTIFRKKMKFANW